MTQPALVIERAVLVTAGPAIDSHERGRLASPSVDGHGHAAARWASRLLHGTVYGDRGFKPCTVYGGLRQDMDSTEPKVD
jgi:hypothetical protein